MAFSLSSHHLPFVHKCLYSKFPLLIKNISHIGLEHTLTDVVLTWSSAKLLFPNKIIFASTGVLEDTIQSISHYASYHDKDFFPFYLYFWPVYFCFREIKHYILMMSGTKYPLFLKVSSTPNVGLELMALRSRVACSMTEPVRGLQKHTTIYKPHFWR